MSTHHETMIIDATDARLGRMATHAAKAALHGKTVVIINCEEALIVGARKNILEKYVWKRELGRPTKGPFLPRMPDRFVRRVVRSMLPYKTPHGRDAFERVMCYIGTPEQFAGKGVRVEDRPAFRFMKVKELCTLLGGRTEAVQ
jgi:large subunit ribosomal protein L13